MYDIDHNFENAREFVDFFLDDNIFEPKSIFDVSEKIVSGYIFRGQGRKEWSLLPSAHRSPDALNNFTPQPPGKKEEEPQKIREYLAHHIHAELRAVQLFLEAADRVGIPTPLDYNALTRHNPILDDLFSGKEIDPKSEFPHQSFLPNMALAQHHGVPTRLLDWSESAYIAAYFAAETAMSNRRSGQEDGYFSVICLGTQLLRKVESIKAVSAPRASNPFLRAQRGVFTLIKNANQFLIKNGRWPSIEDAVEAERDASIWYTRSPLVRLSLPNAEAESLLRLLYRLDVSKLTMMPSLDNAANNLIYKKSLWR
ncbi:FRG domain-containing protein [Desulfosediminicola sp.]|uniref:FRG domain-containing protein n=1 Tax=Desulfosediminicola sp. TaxID=2886825 RepID=UPI003AF2CACE